MRIEAATVYVTPPDVELTVQGDELVPVPASTPGWPHREVDTFLRSLAAAGGSMAIGVILSGAGRDGTVGMKAIKDAGGITFVQEPTTATQSSMPQSAIDANCADFALVAGEIGDELVRLALHPLEGRRRPFKANDREAMATIVAHLRVAFGVDFALYKQSTVERRVARRMALDRVDTIDEYLRLLPSRPSELRSLYGDLLIGVTGFFRDTEPFELLKTTVFPGMVAGRSTESPIRIWVAGCSSGEEAYSVGITLLESLGERAMTYKIQIFATDIDEDALARARLAVYPPSIELDVSPERLSRFFLRTDKGYQVARQVRDIIVFARHNLGTDPPFSHLDLVTSRNVLIYMQTPLQKRVVRVFHYALRHDGHLLLGTSESVGDLTDLFSLVDRRSKLFVKRDAATGPVFDLPRRHMSGARRRGRRLADGPPSSPRHRARRRSQGAGEVRAARRHRRREARGPAVPRAHRPVPGSGAGRGHAQPDEARAAGARDAASRRHQRGPRRRDRGDVASGLDGRRRRLAARQHRGDAPDGGHGPKVHAGPLQGGPRGVATRRRGRRSETPCRRQESARRGARARAGDHQGSTCSRRSRGSEAANEELQSSIEEMQSSNEELKSTNEELETTKEELQSTNEELATMNDELHESAWRSLHHRQRRPAKRPRLHDARHRDRRARPAHPRVPRRRSGAAPPASSRATWGGPSPTLRNVLSTRDIEQLASEAIDTVTSREQRRRGIDGFWYMMKNDAVPGRRTTPSAVWWSSSSGRRRRSPWDRSLCRCPRSTRWRRCRSRRCSWIASSSWCGRTGTSSRRSRWRRSALGRPLAEGVGQHHGAGGALGLPR